MGDRVLFQVTDGTENSPAIYGHWAGERAPQICKDLAARMKSRPGDVQYTAARLVQEICGDSDGNTSVGIWNQPKRLVEKDSHGDAGVVIVHVNDKHGMHFECMGGYLRLDARGIPEVAPIDGPNDPA